MFQTMQLIGAGRIYEGDTSGIKIMDGTGGLLDDITCSTIYPQSVQIDIVGSYQVGTDIIIDGSKNADFNSLDINSTTIINSNGAIETPSGEDITSGGS